MYAKPHRYVPECPVASLKVRSLPHNVDLHTKAKYVGVFL